MSDILQIACAADNNYVQHTCVMLTSLFENNKNNSIHIHLFSADFSIENKQIVENTVLKYNQQFSYYQLNPELFKDCYVSHHVSYATYYRIVIPFVINPRVKKLLYLDTDIIVCKDLAGLWLTDVQSHVLGAIREPGSHNYERLNIPPEFHYFNAGILIINIQSWLNQDLTTRIFTYIKEHKNQLLFWDQDALNANLYDEWIELPPKWNQQTALFEVPRNVLENIYTKEEIKEAMDDPSIIHYTGSSKPWEYLNMHPYKKQYWKYLLLTPWKNYTLKNVGLTKRVQKLFMLILGIKGFQKMMRILNASSN